MDAPTQCARDAGYTAALIGCVVACDWTVPEDLAELWNWYQAGHWPSGFAKTNATDQADEHTQDSTNRLRLLVY